MRQTLIPLLAATLLAACGTSEAPDGNANAAAAFVPPPTLPPTPLPGQAQTTPLDAYAGHYPDEPVDGIGFFDRTEVANALDGAGVDAALRRAIIHNQGPRTPIFLMGKRVATWGCEAHDCGDHNWTLLVDPASGKGEVCDHRDGGTSRWYAGGPPAIRPGGCPSEQQG